MAREDAELVAIVFDMLIGHKKKRKKEKEKKETQKKEIEKEKKYEKEKKKKQEMEMNRLKGIVDSVQSQIDFTANDLNSLYFTRYPFDAVALALNDSVISTKEYGNVPFKEGYFAAYIDKAYLPEEIKSDLKKFIKECDGKVISQSELTSFLSENSKFNF